MNLTNHYAALALFALMSTLFTHTTYAHVMVAQHGILNIAEDGVYMVLSLPITAFAGIDDNDDGRLSIAEFDLHRSAIELAVKDHIILADGNGNLDLKGLLLSPVTEHDSPTDSASQLIVMGRFEPPEPGSPVKYQVSLFGTQPSERVLEIIATNKTNDQQQAIRLTPDINVMHLFVG
jgi:hypothetical protein